MGDDDSIGVLRGHWVRTHYFLVGLDLLGSLTQIAGY
jgi:hypothetical protein